MSIKEIGYQLGKIAAEIPISRALVKYKSLLPVVQEASELAAPAAKHRLDYNMLKALGLAGALGLGTAGAVHALIKHQRRQMNPFRNVDLPDLPSLSDYLG
jgi:hypothetical protein